VVDNEIDPIGRRRALALSVGFFGIFTGLLGRLYTIQVRGHEESVARSESQQKAVVTVQTPREPMYDRNGHILAVSLPVDSVWVNPSAIPDWPGASKILARTLGLREDFVRDQLLRDNREWLWLKRKVAAEEAAAVRGLLEQPPFKIDRKSPEPKIGLVTEYVRRYPFGSLASHLLGHKSDDPKMNEGLERSLDRYIREQVRTVSISVDGRRHPLGVPPVDVTGAEAFLTIDILLQKVVEEELDAACLEHKPKWAAVVVLDPKSGAILALSSRPTFDPNKPGESPASARLDRAVSAPYEPGSTLKPFVCAVALDLGLVRPETKFDCENGIWKHGPRTLHDHHPYGIIPLSDVIAFSSNIGAAKLGALTLGAARLYECMKRWGFGTGTGSDLPAEDPGKLIPLNKWTIYSETSVPMGHEISVTPLQLATAMSAIANGGTLYRPFVVRRVVATDGAVLSENGAQKVRTVISEKTSKEMIEILKKVVTDGTGKKAAVPGVAVAGKTGTSQKIDPVTKQYTHEKYLASFVGFAPADDAKLCIAVVMDEPQGAYYGGAVAAPVVARILERGLIYVR
jgi:cell division protein FtsI (penicillin-binding protein 3)